MGGLLTRSSRITACLLACAITWSLGSSPSLQTFADDKVSESTTKSAVAFAREHHPELADLLEQLRKNAPKEFAAAISDLDKSRQRIARNKESSERYRLELEEWKLNSRIRLLVARLAMGQDSAIEDELRTAIEQRTQLRLELLEEERARLQQRIEKLNEQIAQQKQRSIEQVDKELAALLKSTTTTATKAKDGAGVKPKPTNPKPTNSAKISAKKPEKKSSANDLPAATSADKPRKKNEPATKTNP
ncbi:hypothetical protein GC163_09535 [bacterium]|nr:hypothetical protein [bacterium]